MQDALTFSHLALLLGIHNVPTRDTGVEMKQSITSVYQFRDAFREANRESQFSYDGLEVLFDYLEQLEQDTGEEIELDVIALCCDYAEEEASTLAAFYNIPLDDLEGDEIVETVLAELNNATSVCGVTDSGTIVYKQF